MLATAAYLADAQQSMRSEADKAVLHRMIRKLAPSAVDAAGNAVSATDEVVSATQRPGVKALASDVRAFVSARATPSRRASIQPRSRCSASTSANPRQARGESRSSRRSLSTQ